MTKKEGALSRRKNEKGRCPLGLHERDTRSELNIGTSTQRPLKSFSKVRLVSGDQWELSRPARVR